MLAHYMNDKEYTNEIINGDIHTANQKLAGLESRDQAKTFIMHSSTEQEMKSLDLWQKDLDELVKSSRLFYL